jgi:hypothetical protein
MNSLPLDTWIRLIDWMAIGLVVYFAYSYNNSHLGKLSDTEANVETPVTIAADRRNCWDRLAVLLTFWQVSYLMTIKGGRRSPESGRPSLCVDHHRL